MAFASGMMMGKYELGKLLGQGGFGLVFVARDVGLDRDVALKFLHAEHTANPEILRRFLQEARSAAKIVHPGIVTVFECGQVAGTNTSADGVAFIAMELLHGESLTDRLARSSRLPAKAAIEISRQLASALEAAHHAGIIHRDLKPDNIFLVRDPAMPGGERVKVLDFGIAKLAQAPGSGAQTQSMMVFGTPRYMSPEQCRSAAHIDHRSDIYTLGCILFELVCGAPPFQGETGELIAKHQMVPPPTVRSVASDVSEPLARLIASLLAKDPKDRPQTMAAVQRALEAGGAPSAGVDATMLPDAADSLPRFTPVPGALRASSQVAETELPSPSQARRSAPIGSVGSVNPTTLGASSGQWQEPGKRRSKLPLVIGGIAAVALVAGVTIAAMKSGSDEATASAPAPAAAPSTPAAAATMPAEPAQIELVITSTPVGAEVYTTDNRLLGETPFPYRRPPAEGKLVFFLKLAGYQDARVVMPADASATKEVALTALAKPDPVATTKPVDKPATKPTARPTTKPIVKPTTRPITKPLKPGELPDD